MRRWTLVAAVSALFAAALWHLPATAQHTAPMQPAAPSSSQTAAEAAVQPSPQPVAPQLITFEEYRDFRMRDITERQARLARALTAPDLSATEKANLEARKAYYDRLAAMPSAERDRLFRARFDQIDTNHDGMLDEAERAAWRKKQREHYREVTVEPQPASINQH
jgi:hypothetical protein